MVHTLYLDLIRVFLLTISIQMLVGVTLSDQFLFALLAGEGGEDHGTQSDIFV